MTRVIDDALHADETDTRDAEVAHQFFGVNLTEVRLLHHFLLLVRVLQRQVVLWQFSRFERLL